MDTSIKCMEWNFWKRATQLASDTYLIFLINDFNYIKHLKRNDKQTIIKHVVSNNGLWLRVDQLHTARWYFVVEHYWRQEFVQFTSAYDTMRNVIIACVKLMVAKRYQVSRVELSAARRWHRVALMPPGVIVLPRIWHSCHLALPVTRYT